MTEHGVHHCHSHAILRRLLDFRKRQHSQVGDVGEQIKDNYDAAARHERSHKILSRVAHFAADKRNICPGGLREKRAHH